MLEHSLDFKVNLITLKVLLGGMHFETQHYNDAKWLGVLSFSYCVKTAEAILLQTSLPGANEPVFASDLKLLYNQQQI